MMKTYKAFLALRGLDENCLGYIDYASNIVVQVQDVKKADGVLNASEATGLRSSIIKGFKDNAAAKAQELLQEGIKPVSIIDSEIIPALNEVGEKI